MALVERGRRASLTTLTAMLHAALRPLSNLAFHREWTTRPQVRHHGLRLRLRQSPRLRAEDADSCLTLLGSAEDSCLTLLGPPSAPLRLGRQEKGWGGRMRVEPRLRQAVVGAVSAGLADSSTMRVRRTTLPDPVAFTASGAAGEGRIATTRIRIVRLEMTVQTSIAGKARESTGASFGLWGQAESQRSGRRERRYEV